MDWLEITVKTNHEAVENLCDFLTAVGVDGMIIDDEEEFQDFLEEYRDYWDYVDESLAASMRGLCQIRFYMEDSPSAQTELEDFKGKLEQFSERNGRTAMVEISIKPVRDEDWENNWKAFYRPFDVGERLHVRPCWVDREPPPDRIPLILDPGLIFGTGVHASTRMCLEAVESVVRPGDSVHDLGCGSGILSIACILLEAGKAVGVDIDPMARDIAMKNAGYNGIECFSALTGNVVTDASLRRVLSENPADIVLANIVADVILSLSEAFSSFLKPEGRLICSGILESRSDEVREALERNGFLTDQAKRSDGWVCLVLNTISNDK